MLHDTVLALLGIPGDFFISTPNEIPFKISPKISIHLHPGELHQLEIISIIGGYYHYFIDFIKKNTRVPLTEFDGVPSVLKENYHSLYRMSFCFGLEKSLKSYLDDVKKVENEVLSNLYITLSQFIFIIENYKYLFIYLHDIIQKIEKDELVGFEIFDHLYNIQNYGIPLIVTCIKLILSRMNHVFISWISSSILHGMLADPFKEFFIGQKGPNDSNVFYIREEIGPNFINQETKVKILDIAEAIKNSSKDLSHNLFIYEKTKLKEFSMKLNEIKNNEGFDLVYFENLINDINKYVMAKLWVNISHQVDVHKFFLDLKQIYFFGMGDFYSLFFQNVYSFIESSNQAQPRISSNVRQIFYTSYRQLYPDFDTFETNFEFNSNNLELNHLTFKEMFDHFNIACAIPGPLRILFTNDSIRKFSDAFKYLYKLKSAYFVLQKVWKSITESKGKLKNEYKNIYKTCFHLRRTMSFFIESVLYYVQDDVIEPIYNHFVCKLNSVTDICGIKEFSNDFIQKIQTEIFMNHSSINNQILKIVDLVFNLSEIALNLTAVRTVDETTEILSNIKLNYERSSELVITLLISSIKDGASQTYKSLLLRLDYNHYYSLKNNEMILDKSLNDINKLKIC